MADIGLVVTFDIVIQDASPSRPNFGTIAALAYHGLGPARRVYDTTPAGRNGMVLDGFANTHDLHRKNAAIGAQNPKVRQMKAYNRAAPNEQVLVLTPTGLVDGTRYLFALNGVEVDYTLDIPDTSGWDDDATIDLICEEIFNQLDGEVTNVTVTDNDTNVTLTLTDPEGPRMYLKNTPRWLTVKDTSSDAGIADDLDAMLIEDPDFYGVLIDSMSEPEIIAAAAWCESNGKMLHAQSVDSDILGSGDTDVASDLMAAGYTYAGVFYSRDMAAQLAAAVMGRQFSQNPGATTWENKRIAGVTADNLTPTEITNALNKNCGLFLPISGINVTHGAKSASGRFFDLNRDRDWLQANAQADVFAHLVNQEKVPFTQLGIDQLEGVIRDRFTNAETAGVLDAGWSITLPTIGQVTTAEKAARRLAAANAFDGTFQGAIHGADFAGALAI